MKNNTIKYISFEILIIITGLLTAGTVLQTFMLESGFDEQITSYFEAFIMVVQSASMLLFSGFVERKSNIKGLLAKSVIFANLILLPMLLFCFNRNIKGVVVFAVMCIFAFVSKISLGIENVAIYKLPYQILDMGKYGKVIALSSICGGICATVFSYVIMSVNKTLGFFEGMKYILICGIVFSVVAYFIITSTKVVNDYKASEKSGRTIDILKYKPFYSLLFPNLLRGVYSGIINVAAIIGYHNNAIDSNSALILVIITQIALAAGAFLYSRICLKNMDGRIILIFSVLSSLSLVFITTSSKYVFLISFFISKMVTTVVDNAIPVAVTKIVDYSHIGRYTALRMLTHTLGSAIGAAVILHIIDGFGKIPAMIFSGMCILVCGTAYFIYFNKNKTIKI